MKNNWHSSQIERFFFSRKSVSILGEYMPYQGFLYFHIYWHFRLRILLYIVVVTGEHFRYCTNMNTVGWIIVHKIHFISVFISIQSKWLRTCHKTFISSSNLKIYYLYYLDIKCKFFIDLLNNSAKKIGQMFQSSV